MQHPFSELTNRTPSPSQKEESAFARKHSPWTAARQKKKTRAVDQQQLLEGVGCAAPQQQQQQQQDVHQQQAIPEAVYNSPAAHIKSVGGSAEYSFADRLSPAAASQGTTASPHSSPPVSKGSADDAEVHPAKAYLQEPQALSSPQCPMDLGSAGGVLDLAAAGAHASTRSPVWFCSNSNNGGAHGDAGGGSTLQAGLHLQDHSSRAPASGNLFERFDQVAQQRRQQQQQQHSSQQHYQPQQHSEAQLQQQHSGSSNSHQQQRQQQPATGQPGGGGGGVVRGRRLTARRGVCGGGAEQLQRSLAAGALGGLAGVRQQGSLHHHLTGGGGSSSSHAALLSAAAAAAGGSSMHDSSDTADFQLHSRLNLIDDTVVERRRSFGSGFLQRQHWDKCSDEGCGAEDEEGGGDSDGGDDWGLLLRRPSVAAAAAWRCAAAGFDQEAEGVGVGRSGEGGADDAGTLEWYEAEMQEAADAGDMPAARQLWASLQAAGLGPTRRFLNSFLICCHYGGVDPVEAQEAVRDMCEAAGAGGLEPDGLTAQLLSAIDISWQQLQCALF